MCHNIAKPPLVHLNQRGFYDVIIKIRLSDFQFLEDLAHTLAVLDLHGNER